VLRITFSILKFLTATNYVNTCTVEKCELGLSENNKNLLENMSISGQPATLKKKNM